MQLLNFFVQIISTWYVRNYSCAWKKTSRNECARLAIIMKNFKL